MHHRILIAISGLMCAGTVCAQQGGGQSTGMFGSILPMMLVMFAIIYFLMIRPEQKKQKKRQAMLDTMKKGDRVLTIGGVYGVLQNIKGESAMVKISENTVVEMNKSAVSSVITKEEPSKKNESKDKK